MKYTLLFLSCLLVSSGASAVPSNAQLTTALERENTIIDTVPITPPADDFPVITVKDPGITFDKIGEISSGLETTTLNKAACSGVTCGKGQTCVDGCCKFQ